MMQAAHNQRRRMWLKLAFFGLLGTASLWWLYDERSRLLVMNTVRLATGTCAIAVPVGALLALILVRTDAPCSRWIFVGLIVMAFIPLHLQCAGWQAGFGQQGWVTLLNSSLGDTPLLDGWRGAIWVHVLQAVPWVTLIVGAGLWFSEPQWEENALLDGSAWRVFFRVTLLRTLPGIGIATLWVVVTTTSEITVTNLFRIRTYADEVHTGFYLGEFAGNDHHSFVLGGGLLTGLIVVGWLFAVSGTLFSFIFPATFSTSGRPPWIFRLGIWRWPTALVACVVLVVGWLVPLANLCYKAGLQVQMAGADRVRTWSLLKCLYMVADSPREFGVEFGWSLGIGALSATTALAVGALLAWWARSNYTCAAVASLAAALCLALPGSVLGRVIIWLLNRRESEWLVWLYDQSIFAPWTALLVRCFPLTMIIAWHAFRTIPHGVLESASADGAGSLVQLWRIALPLRIRPLACAWLISLAIAVSDLAAVVLVVPPGVGLLSVRIFGLLHIGVEDRVAGICLANSIMLVILAFTTIGLARLYRPAVGRREMMRIR